MPKDNEVDEKVMPFAWQWLDTSIFRKSIPSAAIREHWNPLYSAATVAELRAEVDGLREANQIYSFAMNTAGIDELKRRADAAERRVGELEALLAAIRLYAQHDDACGDMDAYNNATIESCGCGLDSLLDAASEVLTGADPT